MRVTQNDLPKQNGCLKLSEMIVTKMIMFLTLALHDLDLQATRGKILPDKFEQYLMRNPCRWPLSHILGSTQIESFLGPETGRSYIYIFRCIFIYWYNTYTRVYNVHMYMIIYICCLPPLRIKVTRICSQIDDLTSPMELQMKEHQHHDICLLNSGNNLTRPCLSCTFKVEFGSGNTW